MTDHDKALEAAARAMARRNYPSGSERDIDMMWEGWLPDAQAAIAAYLAQREADGFVMVPVEPTTKMREEGLFANDNALLPSADCNDMANAYRAMLAARPKGDG